MWRKNVGLLDLSECSHRLLLFFSGGRPITFECNLYIHLPQKLFGGLELAKKLIQRNQLAEERRKERENMALHFLFVRTLNRERRTTRASSKAKKMLFLLCHNIKTDIIMRITVYLFGKIVCFFRLFWHCHGIYVSLESVRSATE